MDDKSGLVSEYDADGKAAWVKAYTDALDDNENLPGRTDNTLNRAVRAWQRWQTLLKKKEPAADPIQAAFGYLGRLLSRSGQKGTHCRLRGLGLFWPSGTSTASLGCR